MQRLTIHHKDMRRTHWRRIAARRYAFGEASFAGFTGPTGLIALDKVIDPFIADGVTVAGDGFTWFQFAPENAHWWLTAMFDPSGVFVQGYIDISLCNHPLPNGNSWFEDLFLDIVVHRDLTLTVLDRDELDLALCQGVITSAQHALALGTAQTLLSALSRQPEALPDFCRRQRCALLPLLPSVDGR